MIPQIQPNRWSCLPTAFAIVLDRSVRYIIDQIGDDGSEIIHPELPEPQCRKGFHPQQLVDYCISRGIHVVCIEAVPMGLINKLSHQIWDHDYCKKRMENYLMTYDGVLTGTTINNREHAVVWDHINQFVIDPNGTTYDIRLFNIGCLWLII